MYNVYDMKIIIGSSHTENYFFCLIGISRSSLQPAEPSENNNCNTIEHLVVYPL